ncbi:MULTISPECIES: sensor histidine kinase KdpD [unclassified Streptomyces]|uniref:sensor histidine kinase n=1 Tax=unclassified Streptomyces TaxID=2593676 RepID=UPI00210876A5|nr:MULTISPECIES: ATP-binding protein [unclassified Streptomyces]
MVHSSPGLTIHGWQPGLRSLLDNLLTNALVHGRSAEGGAHVALSLRAGEDSGSPCVVPGVEDRGPGVPRQRREAVFQRFQRRPDSPGSGLGLTLVAQQAALHRAGLRLLDGPGGRGARFEVVFPAAPAHRPQHTALPARRDWLADPADRPQGFHKEHP